MGRALLDERLVIGRVTSGLVLGDLRIEVHVEVQFPSHIPRVGAEGLTRPTRAGVTVEW